MILICQWSVQHLVCKLQVLTIFEHLLQPQREKVLLMGSTLLCSQGVLCIFTLVRKLCSLPFVHTFKSQGKKSACALQLCKRIAEKQFLDITCSFRNSDKLLLKRIFLHLWICYPENIISGLEISILLYHFSLLDLCPSASWALNGDVSIKEFCCSASWISLYFSVKDDQFACLFRILLGKKHASSCHFTVLVCNLVLLISHIYLGF